MFRVLHHGFTPMLAAALLAALILPSVAAPVRAAGNAEFLAVTNQYRGAAEVPPVGANAVLEAIAVERSNAMAEADHMAHDLDLIGARLNASGVCWRTFGEIIAYNGTGSITRFGEQWFKSTSHREIMLGDGYTHAGGSTSPGPESRHYGAMIFAELCGTSDTTTTSGFTDIGLSAFKAEIGWLVTNEVTAGCTASKFCPRAAVTREQMASFLRRVTGLPAQSSGWFTDVSSSMHRADINGIAAAKIAVGCTDARYCPTSTVTRGQMASFLARTLSLPVSARDYFWDDNGTTHEGAVNSLAAAGITGGCSAGQFCPNSPVTREQMAGFLERAFGG